METIFTRIKPFIPTPGVIGVCGTGAGVGTTHLCIALANYLCSKFYADTAYLEMNASHAIGTLAGNPAHAGCFHKKRVAYYPDMSMSAAQEVLDGRYRYHVLDFGRPAPRMFEAFLTCDLRVVIGSVSPWKREQYHTFRLCHLQQYHGKEVTFVYIGNFMEDSTDIELLSRTLDVRLIPMPYFPNPFHVASSHFGFFDEILKRKK